MRFDKDTTKQVARLVELHLRFHGYGDGQWTDSAVRRYVNDAGPLLTRLHRLTRSDCTTRNVRKAQRLSRAYDDLEQRIERLAAEEELASVRPELDGNEIAEALGIKPGPGARAGLQLPAVGAPRRRAHRQGRRPREAARLVGRAWSGGLTTRPWTGSGTGSRNSVGSSPHREAAAAVVVSAGTSFPCRHRSETVPRPI